MPAWNRDGEELEDCNALQAAVSLVDPNANAWRRDKNLPPQRSRFGHIAARASVNQRSFWRSWPGVGSTCSTVGPDPRCGKLASMVVAFLLRGCQDQVSLADCQARVHT